MYRRIELVTGPFKHGLMGIAPLDVIEAWIDLPQAPKHLNKNCRFYWTEYGWKLYGSKTVGACKKAGQKFRILTVKECSVDLFYKDKWQVAIRPRKQPKEAA